MEGGSLIYNALHLNFAIHLFLSIHQHTCMSLQLSTIFATCIGSNFFNGTLDILEEVIIILEINLNLSPPLFPKPILLFEWHFFLSIVRLSHSMRNIHRIIYNFFPMLLRTKFIQQIILQINKFIVK